MLSWGRWDVSLTLTDRGHEVYFLLLRGNRAFWRMWLSIWGSVLWYLMLVLVSCARSISPLSLINLATRSKVVVIHTVCEFLQICWRNVTMGKPAQGIRGNFRLYVSLFDLKLRFTTCRLGPACRLIRKWWGFQYHFRYVSLCHCHLCASIIL